MTHSGDPLPGGPAVAPLGWLGIARLGLVQTALGAIVILCTSTMNRVMVVELGLPALVPGLLVGFHFAIQLARPRLGYGSDLGGRRTPWIIGGMAILSTGGILAAVAIAVMTASFAAGIAVAIVAFFLIGIGVGAAGTTLLVLLAKRTAPGRRAAAATIVWTMMIVGFVVTATIAGDFLDPFSIARLITVTSAVALVAFLVSIVAVWGVEQSRHQSPADDPGEPAKPKVPFRVALAQVWAERRARRFAIFVFVSMIAYSAQDLILEPFAGAIFGLTPGESTKLAGIQHSGVLLGMVLVGIAGSTVIGPKIGTMKGWTIAGCLASALALTALAIAGMIGPPWPLLPSVFALGAANGAYAVAAIGSMMGLASSGRESREGVRMGVWGAAQAIAFGAGGVLGTAAVDLTRYLVGSPAAAYSLVFAGQAILFVYSAHLAARIEQDEAERAAPASAMGLVGAGD